MSKQVIIRFNLWAILFFVLLETCTVPLVAISNQFVITHILYMAVMGFLVALFVVGLLFRSLKQLVIRNSLALFDLQLVDIYGIVYVGVLGGILEMIMFIIQDFMFHHGYNVYIVGFISALGSVGLTLLFYECFGYLFRWSIILVTVDRVYTLRFHLLSILKLSLIFGGYELIVCPITGWWIPYYGQARVWMAILSGIVGGACGGYFIYLVTRFIKPLTPYFTICDNS